MSRPVSSLPLPAEPDGTRRHCGNQTKSPAHAADRARAGIAVLSAATPAFLRKRFVHDFTSRFRGHSLSCRLECVSGELADRCCREACHHRPAARRMSSARAAGSVKGVMCGAGQDLQGSPGQAAGQG